MTKKNDGRVLSRLGAHELTQEETDQIFGGGNRFNTVATHTQTLPLVNPDSDFDE